MTNLIREDGSVLWTRGAGKEKERGRDAFLVSAVWGNVTKDRSSSTNDAEPVHREYVHKRTQKHCHTPVNTEKEELCLICDTETEKMEQIRGKQS